MEKVIIFSKYTRVLLIQDILLGFVLNFYNAENGIFLWFIFCFMISFYYHIDARGGKWYNSLISICTRLVLLLKVIQYCKYDIVASLFTLIISRNIL